MAQRKKKFSIKRRRRVLILLMLTLFAVLGMVLFTSMRPSTLFRIAAPISKPAESEAQHALDSLPAGVASNTLAHPLESVSGTTLLERPRYTGQDSMGRNWTVQAETAAQSGSSASGTYILQQVGAIWNDPSQTNPFALTATEGRYQPSSSALLLTGEVSASGAGYTLTAPRIDADLSTRKLKATGGSRVTGQTPGWNVQITAPELDADQNGGQLLLTGGVRATFTPTKAPR